ncbi:MAG: dihydrolipoamide acetyltransferase family protein [Cyclobacteriaceae bacterium]
MEKEIKLPQISEGDDTGLVSDIYVKEGDQVEAEQSIVAIESDKATVDVPVEKNGKVTAVKVKEGDEINVGDILILLEIDEEESSSEEDQEGSDANKEASEKESQKEQKNQTKKSDTSSEKEADDKVDGENTDERADPDGSDVEKNAENESSSIPAAPLAKKFARELGIDIQELRNDDPEQRITREDVFNYAKKRITQQPSSESVSKKQEAPELPDFTKWGDVHREPMSSIRRITAKNTAQSWNSIPHVTHFDNAEISGLQSFIDQQNDKSETKITITAAILKVITEALIKFPKFNASIDINEKEVVYKDYYHVGIAVDTSDGLLMPVIRDVDQKSIPQLSEELADMASKARSGQLSSQDMAGGNFVISNLGGIGGTNFTPIIFPPQVAILGMSRAQVTPVYEKGEFVPKQLLPLALSYDHRLIDGADAARFMKWVSQVIEQPMNLLA